MCNNMDTAQNTHSELKEPEQNAPAPQKRVYTIPSHLHKILEKRKLIYGESKLPKKKRFR